MSNQPTTSQDEMDLSDVFALGRRGFYQFMALGFKAIDFLLKFWWAVLALIATGVILGIVLSGDPDYKATLVIQTNFETQPYVYNAIEQFNLNLKEDDSLFIQKVGLDPMDSGINKITVDPIIDVVNLLEMVKTGDRNLETVLGELNYEDDKEIFATDRFYSSYKYHKLILEMSPTAGQKQIDALMDYVNNNPLIKKMSTESRKNRIELIAQNEQMLKQMDDVVKAFVVTNEVANKNSGSMSFFNNSSNVDLRQLFVRKGELALENEELKNELITMEDAAVIVSEVQTSKDEGITDKKYIVYPLILVFLFMLIAGVLYTYRTLRKTLQRENLLD
jgi:hypothetical protein